MGIVYKLQAVAEKGEVITEPVKVYVTFTPLIVVGGTAMLEQNCEYPMFEKSMQTKNINFNKKYLKIILIKQFFIKVKFNVISRFIYVLFSI
tara:strand:+ start:357 stop:632 length:276 start_codon:yes stop_codon:yes gene_type:complete